MFEHHTTSIYIGESSINDHHHDRSLMKLDAQTTMPGYFVLKMEFKAKRLHVNYVQKKQNNTLIYPHVHFGFGAQRTPNWW